jgi:3-methyl-2-oxobutanoate hydroxymethyltransferase
MKKVTINTLRKYKKENRKVVWITAYDYPQARCADQAGVDMILVGDSAGNTTHGFESTIPMTMDLMIPHAEAVSRGAKRAFLVGDMPFMSYQQSDEIAVENAGRFIRAGMDAVKLEGYMPDRVRAINEAGILVCGHLGLTPQSKAKLGGYVVAGKNDDAIRMIVEDAESLESCDLSLLLLEAMPPEAAEKVVDQLMIPVYGIGAGDKVDGQLLIFHDVVGLSFDFKCKFARKYAETEDVWQHAINQYAFDVREQTFPKKQYFYKMDSEG